MVLVASTGEEAVRVVKERAEVTKDAAHVDLVRCTERGEGRAR